jgi:hypothetical protein
LKARTIQPYGEETAIKCCETSEHEIQTLGINPKERIQHSVHGKSFKSRIIYSCLVATLFSASYEPSFSGVSCKGPSWPNLFARKLPKYYCKVQLVPAVTVMCGHHIVATPDLHYFESGDVTLILASLPKFPFLAGDFLKIKCNA